MIRNIMSWSDTKIEIEVPAVNAIYYENINFSLKFKVFRINDKLNKLPVSRVKSRASRGKERPPDYSERDTIIARIKRLRLSYGLSEWPASSITWKTFHWQFAQVPRLKRGDIIKGSDNDRPIMLTQDATMTTNDPIGRPQMEALLYNGFDTYNGLLQPYGNGGFYAFRIFQTNTFCFYYLK